MFLVDSGALNNFLSLNDAKRLGLQLKVGAASVVRLADGKKLKTNQYVECLVSFGKIQAVQRFEVLDCSCLPILGYTFLSQLNPTINWKKK